MRPEAVCSYTTTLLCLLLSSFESLEGQTCDKFSEFNDKAMGTVGGACYYGFTETYDWSSADDLCQGKATHLVHLQTTTKQQDVFNALGSNFGQHWTGLRYLSGAWTWYYNSSYHVVATNDVSGRWEGSTSGQCAYTMTSNQIVLKAASLNSQYRPVCEDSHGASASPEVPTTSDSVDSQVTEQSASAVGANSGLFHHQTSLTTAQFLKKFPCSVKSACAVWCLATSDCRHFAFLSSLRWCELYKDQESSTSTSPTCGAEQECYSEIS